MPQLILYPWFFIFLLIWFTLSTLSPKKILSYSPMKLITLNSLTHQSHPWTWPW
uniref:ATP synthase complex subunit 8 n=1 Tax=Cornufer vitianus TaxID=1582976 RepID=A0A0K0LFF5_CORVT|nr:ATP synthase F0 subunit 8 [Cornufer vitianus]AIZ97075.1 ATP synthase F0 subunit 8 [Cornufer vitianus]